MKTPYDLAEKLDEYESIKQSFRQEFPKKSGINFKLKEIIMEADPKKFLKR